MKMHLARLLVCLAALFASVASVPALEACTPAQRAELKEAAPVVLPALERATCVVIRAFSTDGRALDVCATADELAPFLAELLASRAAEQPSAVVAFAITPPGFTARRRVARRRCVTWQNLEGGDGGPGQASGIDRGASDGGGEGDGGGRTVDGGG